MAEFFKALDVPLDEDLLPLSVLLRERDVPHRVVERSGRQVLEVAHAEQVEVVHEFYRAWRAGEIDIHLQRLPRDAGGLAAGTLWMAAPVTLALVALSLLAFLLVYVFGALQLWSLLSFTPFDLVSGQLVTRDGGGEYWRLVTPIFLHFGWMHIVFNCLWLWELGRRIEEAIGHFNLLMLCMVIAATSNVCQSYFTVGAMFGGMSGVVYGLLGFGWVASQIQPAWQIRPRNAVMALLMVWLVLCLVGFVESLGFGAIANAAHVSGLIVGAVLGAVFGLLSRAGNDKAGAR